MHGCDSHHTVGYSETKDASRAVDERLRDEGRSEERNRDRLSSAYSASYCLSILVSLAIVLCLRLCLAVESLYKAYNLWLMFFF